MSTAVDTESGLIARGGSVLTLPNSGTGIVLITKLNQRFFGSVALVEDAGVSVIGSDSRLQRATDGPQLQASGRENR
jgi:hypothetical protein